MFWYSKANLKPSSFSWQDQACKYNNGFIYCRNELAKNVEYNSTLDFLLSLQKKQTSQTSGVNACFTIQRSCACTDNLFLTSWNKTGEVELPAVQQYPYSSNYNAKSAQTLKGLLTAIKKDPSECGNLLIETDEYV